MDAPILKMLNEWNGHQIEFIIIIKHYTNIHYFNVSVGQCETPIKLDWLFQSNIIWYYDNLALYDDRALE